MRLTCVVPSFDRHGFSSSLVAFHYACKTCGEVRANWQLLGANVMMRPEYPMGMCKGHIFYRVTRVQIV